MPISCDLQAALGDAAAKSLLGAADAWSRTWGVPALLERVKIEKNARLRTTIARYRIDTDSIELGPRFFRLRSRRLEILAHELAHAAVRCVYGPGRRVHGQEWKNFVKASGFMPTPYLRSERPGSLLAARRSEGSRIFVHRCPVCQMTRSARRAVHRWKCASCVRAGLSGKLEIDELAGSEI